MKLSIVGRWRGEPVELADSQTIEALIMLFHEGQNRSCAKLKPGDVFSLQVRNLQNPPR